MFKHILDKANKANIAYLNERLASLSPDRRWTVDVKEYKSKRSIQQNSLLWAMYNELGSYIGESPDRVHELMGWKFLRELKNINGQSVEVIKSTTKLNTKEMSEYINAIELFGNELGYYFQSTQNA